MAPFAPTPSFRGTLEERIHQLLDEYDGLVAAQVSERLAELERKAAAARDRCRVELAETLNQSARRIRQASGFAEAAAALAEGALTFCNGAAVLRIERDMAIGECIRGVKHERCASFTSLEIPLSSASALAEAVRTGDPVVALNTPGQISESLRQMATDGSEERVSLFPLTGSRAVEGLLCCWGKAMSAPLELLAQVAGLSLSPRARIETAADTELVTIGPAPAMKTSAVNGTEAISAEDQHRHLRAQRFARVQVAEMRLYQAEAVNAGRIARDLYAALKAPIDAARAKFLESFVPGCAGMVDYLHLEILRTLANDDAALLGENYPGPLV
jgi:hypothetical protein